MNDHGWDDRDYDAMCDAQDAAREDAPEAPVGICTECGAEADGVTVDEGIGSYEYWGMRGTHHDYRTVSKCCEADLAEEGGVVVDMTTEHTARKDHTNEHGRVIVRKGHRYRKHYRRSWYVNDEGDTCGVVFIEKQEVQ